MSRLLRRQRVWDLGCPRKSLSELALCCVGCERCSSRGFLNPCGRWISILLKLLDLAERCPTILPGGVFAECGSPNPQRLKNAPGRGTNSAVGMVVGFYCSEATALCSFRCCRGGHDIMVDVTERLGKLAPQCEVASFCHRWKIHELSLFGSVLHDDFGPTGDIDLLVSFDDDSQWSLWDFTTMQDELGALFDRRVNLAERDGLRNPSRRNRIQETRRVMYVT